MAGRAESADERALRRELQELSKKREALDNSKLRGNAATTRGVAGRRSVFARLGGEPTRPEGTGRQVLQLKENNVRGNVSRRLGKRDNEDIRQSSAVKRQRLHSAVTRPESTHHVEGRVESSRTSTTAASPDADGGRAQERKQRAVAPYAQKEGIARSRRMFGALMGHLGKAKRQIEKDTDLFKRQDTKQHKAEQREKIQSQNLENHARHEAEVARLEALVARTELDRSEQIARSKLEHLQMVRKSESQSKFLVTIASPPIYYLPAKHTKETKELVAASMEAHEAKMKASVQTYEEKLRQLEAEFATKLERVREELEAAKKGRKEKDANKEDAVEGSDENMDQVSNEVEEDTQKKEQEYSGKEVCGKSPQDSPMQVEDVQENLSDSEDDNSVTEAKDDKAAVKSDTKSASKENDKGVSVRKTSHGASVTHSDTEASSPSRVKEEKVAKEEAKSPKQNDKAAVKKDGEEAESMDDDNAKQENNDADTEALAEPKEDPAVRVDKMKVTELRAELKKRCLDTKGLKAKLVQRLEQAMHEDNEST